MTKLFSDENLNSLLPLIHKTMTQDITDAEERSKNFLRQALSPKIYNVNREWAPGIFKPGITLFFNGGKAITDFAVSIDNSDLTLEALVWPEYQNRDRLIFAHGGKLKLYLTNDLHLKVTVASQTFTTSDTIKGSGFIPVAVVIGHETTVIEEQSEDPQTATGEETGSDSSATSTSWYVELFSGPNQLGKFSLDDAYVCNGALFIGGLTNSSSNYFIGRICDFRFWKRALTKEEIGCVYAFKRLSGQEPGLAYYFPMDEGTGKRSFDKVQGAIIPIPFTWSATARCALHIEREDNGFDLQEKAFKVSKLDSYTISFWFLRNLSGPLLSNGMAQAGEENQFFIGWDPSTGKFVYRTNGVQHEILGTYTDSAWHHFALSVNKKTGMGKIVLDGILKVAFPTDDICGIEGSATLGALRNNGTSTSNFLKGDIAELAFFEKALSLEEIRRLSESTLDGNESGLRFYLPFGKNNTDQISPATYTPTPYCQKTENKEAEVFLFGGSLTPEDIISHITHFAPPIESRILTLVTETERLSLPRIEGQLRSSLAAPLKWVTNSIFLTVDNESQADAILVLECCDASDHAFRIENIPEWMTIEKTQGLIKAGQQLQIKIRTDEDLPAGDFQAHIAVVDESLFCDILEINMKVISSPQQWGVDPSLKYHTMTIFAEVSDNNDIDTDQNDIIGVFDDNEVCRGKAYIGTGGDCHLARITVFSDTLDNTPLNFRLWRSDSGIQRVLNTTEVISFNDGEFLGSIKAPVRLTAGNFIQEIDLKPGDNDISFHVYSEKFFNWNNFNTFNWTEGDSITDLNSSRQFVFNGTAWVATEGTYTLSILPQRYYRFYVQNEMHLIFKAGRITQNDSRMLSILIGNSHCGVPTDKPVPIGLVMQSPNLCEGDRIISEGKMAVLSGSEIAHKWYGDLKYFVPGKPYLIQSATEKRFSVIMPSQYHNDNLAAFFKKQSDAIIAPDFSEYMVFFAQINGISLENDDRLLAFSQDGNGQDYPNCCGVATIDGQGCATILVGGILDQNTSFAIMRQGSIIAMTDEVFSFTPDTVQGTSETPIIININHTDNE